MSKVEVRPSGQIFEIDENISLKDALKLNGINIKSSCGGVASCGFCIVKILGGEDNITPMEYKELKLLGNIFHITKERLSCQVRVNGDIIVDVSGHLDGKIVAPVEVKQRDKSSSVIRKTAADLAISNAEKIKEEFAPVKKTAIDENINSWEVAKDPMRPKRLGGNKKPRLFNYDENDYNKENDRSPNTNPKKNSSE